MLNLVSALILSTAVARAQSAQPAASTPSSSSISEAQSGSAADIFPGANLDGRVSLLRGTLKRMDPVRNQLVLHTFGGGDLHIWFDPRTKLVAESGNSRWSALTVGQILSIDAVSHQGKLFARSVRTEQATSSEMSGQIVSYDATRSRLTLRDRMSPQQFSLKVLPSTVVTNGTQPSSMQGLQQGMLVHVWFTASDRSASHIEILAQPGNTYVFQGRVIALDLRSRMLSLSNDTDQSVRELSFAGLDDRNVSSLKEGIQVNIQARFDGDHYNILSVTPVSSNPASPNP